MLVPPAPPCACCPDLLPEYWQPPIASLLTNSVGRLSRSMPSMGCTSLDIQKWVDKGAYHPAEHRFAAHRNRVCSHGKMSRALRIAEPLSVPQKSTKARESFRESHEIGSRQRTGREQSTRVSLLSSSFWKIQLFSLVPSTARPRS